MRLIFSLTIFGGDAAQQYGILDPVPFCECNQDEQWGSWQGCDQACSDEQIKQIRSRTCEGIKPTIFDPHYCPKGVFVPKKYYVQEQYRICDSIPLCGELNKIEYEVEIILFPSILVRMGGHFAMFQKLWNGQEKSEAILRKRETKN